MQFTIASWELSLLEIITPKETFIMQSQWVWTWYHFYFKPTINITRTDSECNANQTNKPALRPTNGDVQNVLVFKFLLHSHISPTSFALPWGEVVLLPLLPSISSGAESGCGGGSARGWGSAKWKASIFLIAFAFRGWCQPKGDTRAKHRWDSRRFRRRYGFMLDQIGHITVASEASFRAYMQCWNWLSA